MKKSYMVVAAGLLAACSQSEPPPPPPVLDPATEVAVEQGMLVGFTDAETGAHAWRVVPFAAPPEGDLRWRAPRPAADWEGARAALDQPERCPQLTSPLDGDDVEWGQLIGQEDCLYMNIYAPPGVEDAPVMMWIHGGSNTWGYAAQYNGGHLAMEHGVIVAVVQYRLGPVGWFAHESLRASAETEDDVSANFGILDQIAALEWIEANIDSFGGNPENVTIFGESAGAMNVAALMGSPRAEGLFDRAIMQSGLFRSTPLEEAEVSHDYSARKVAETMLGQESPDAAALRSAPLADLFAAYGDDPREFDPPRLIEDGVVLPDGPLIEAFRSPETFNAVPLITGTNRDEMKLFNVLDERLVKQAWGRFPKARDPLFYNKLSDYQSQLWRVQAVDEPLDIITAGGHADVWAYRFDWDEAGKVFVSDFAQLLGAAHAIEIPFVFGRFQFLGDADRFVFMEKSLPGREALSGAMMSYWANFAKTGEPAKGADGALAEWTRWPGSEEGERIMIFDSPADGGWRMQDGKLSAEDVTSSIASDPALSKEGQRCLVFKGVQAGWPDRVLTPPEGCEVSN